MFTDRKAIKSITINGIDYVLERENGKTFISVWKDEEEIGRAYYERNYYGQWVQETMTCSGAENREIMDGKYYYFAECFLFNEDISCARQEVLNMLMEKKELPEISYSVWEDTSEVISFEEEDDEDEEEDEEDEEDEDEEEDEEDEEDEEEEEE